ncbi:MAG TPA: hypothetical protein VEW07_02315 [Solirubrobacterales bacterium]|nr:hypothetical protein [Solirubrobacterales bacterium]
MRKKAFLAVALTVLALASLASAETIQKGNLRVAFDGKITPSKLPREGSAAVTVAVGTTITSTTPGKPPPRLTKISIAINRHGHLDSTGLPVCEVSDIQPATTAKALVACRGSLVGEGSFAATVALSRQGTFPSEGKLVAFNGTYENRPAILAHVYGTEPVPTSFTLPFVITESKGTFATTLTAVLPRADDNFVTGLELTLNRSFTYRGQKRSYASAGCPAPKGFPGATFPFAKASYAFAGAGKLSSTLTRSCRARG